MASVSYHAVKSSSNRTFLFSYQIPAWTPSCPPSTCRISYLLSTSIAFRVTTPTKILRRRCMQMRCPTQHAIHRALIVTVPSVALGSSWYCRNCQRLSFDKCSENANCCAPRQCKLYNNDAKAIEFGVSSEICLCFLTYWKLLNIETLTTMSCGALVKNSFTLKAK